MALNTEAVLTALAGWVSGLSGVQRVYEGVPEDLSHQVSAYVALGGQTLTDRPTGTLHREANYLVVFGHAVAGAEQSAERQIADLIDAFIAKWLTDRKINNTCETSKLDLTLADTPTYQVFADQEFRVYPIVVQATQRATFTV